MFRDEYPPQTTNPARDLYKFWYGIVSYHAPHLLNVPYDPSEYKYEFPAAFTFKNGYSLHVDRETVTGRSKPALYASGLMKIWPNGHFLPMTSARAEYWAKRELEHLEELTFLRWGHVARKKALWVQDTPRRGHSEYGTNRAYPEADDFERRTPYLILFHSNLFQRGVTYRLKRDAKGNWLIAAAGYRFEDDYQRGARERALRAAVKNAQATLDERYAIAEDRYRRYERRAELAKLREERAVKAKPKSPEISALARVNLERMMLQNMTVWEPKRAPGGKTPKRQMHLPMEEEVTTSGC